MRHFSRTTWEDKDVQFRDNSPSELVSVLTLSTGMTHCPATQDETRNNFAPHFTVLAVEMIQLENLP